MTLEAPQQQGDMLSQADCLNHTMIVAPTEFIEHIQTVNTKPGEKSPAIRVNVADFSADPHNPTIYRGVLWFGVISGALRRQIGSFIACRMGQGAASPGRNAPWQLIDITQEADWMAFLSNWLDNTTQGTDFQVEAIEELNRVNAAAAAAPAPAAPQANAQQAPAPAAAPAPQAPPAPPAAPPASAPAPAPASAPGATAAPAPAPGAGNLADQLAGLPAGELQKVMALLAQQGQAAH